MPRLIECVPNVSEGRRGDVIDRFADAIRGTEGVRLLDRTSDVDHNRSVFTYAGEPEAVVAATHALIDLALKEVDMRTHKGEHPRLGAVDVVPFVPLAGVTMDECVEIAHRFGHEVAERHKIPVYFYAKAAKQPERVRLPDIRKPQYEGLAELLDTTHVPDAGPRTLHPTGGLPAIQAKGLMLTDPPRAQVSMNLLDHTVTSLATVWREVETRASAAGVKLLRGELIGLLPLDAALQVTAGALRLEGFTRDRIIESHFLE